MLLLLLPVTSAAEITGYFVVANEAPVIKDVQFSPSPIVFGKNVVSVGTNPVFVRVTVDDPNGFENVYVSLNTELLEFDGKYWVGTVDADNIGVHEYIATASDGEHIDEMTGKLKVEEISSGFTGAVSFDSIFSWFRGLFV